MEREVPASATPGMARMAFQNPVRPLLGGFEVRGFAPGNADVEGQHALRIEARRDSSQFLKTANQQPGARQQGHRKRHLNAYQHKLDGMRPDTCERLA